MALPKPKATEETNAEIAQEAAAAETAANEPNFDRGEDKSGASAVPTSTAAAAAPARSTAVAPATSLGNVAIVNNVVTVKDNEALAGLKLDAFSFPIIVQEKGSYRFTDDNSFLGNAGKSFEFIINSTRPKYYYKEKTTSDDVDAEGHYSFDAPGPEALTTGGELVAEIVAKWTAEGKKWERKDYLDIQGVVVDEAGGKFGEHHGKFATLSVSPTSVGKISGKILELVKRYGSDTTQYVVEFSAPTKVGEGSKAFYPFSMRYVRPVTPAAT